LKKEIIKYISRDFVHYAGRKHGNDKMEKFANSDIIILPLFYYNETFGLVNLGAMQH